MPLAYRTWNPAPRESGRTRENDRTYWLRRAAVELRMAQRTCDARAKLVHYDLSGLYSIKARLASSSEDEPVHRSVVHVGEAYLHRHTGTAWFQPQGCAEMHVAAIHEVADGTVFIGTPEIAAFATARPSRRLTSSPSKLDESRS